MVMNKGVKIRWKEVTEDLFIVVGPILEPNSTAIKKSKGYL